jgi:hypothetical protein
VDYIVGEKLKNRIEKRRAITIWENSWLSNVGEKRMYFMRWLIWEDMSFYAYAKNFDFYDTIS